MGRNAKPTAKKLLDGNPGKREINFNEPKPLLRVIGDPPAWLDRSAHKMYIERGEMLHRLGVLTEADFEAWGALCQSFARYLQAEEDVKKYGLMIEQTNKFGATNLVKNPACTISRDNLMVVIKLLGKFGMTPSDRAGLVADVPDDVDPFDSFVNKKARPKNDGK